MRDRIVRRDLFIQARHLIDAKLTGPRRAEAIGFIHNRISPRMLQGLIDRLTPLPDLAENRNSRFSPEQADLIRQRHADGATFSQLTKEFRCGHGTIDDVIYRKGAYAPKGES